MLLWSVAQTNCVCILQADVEGAIQAMNDLLNTPQDQENGWGVLLVDAANAFNSLYCAALLLHAHLSGLIVLTFLTPIGDGQY